MIQTIKAQRFNKKTIQRKLELDSNEMRCQPDFAGLFFAISG